MVEFWLKFKSQSQGMVSLLVVVVVAGGGGGVGGGVGVVVGGGGGGVAQVSAYCSESPTNHN